MFSRKREAKMPKWVVLNDEEIELLDRQDPATARDGGIQHFLVDLQSRLRRPTQELKLTDEDLEKIPHLAFDMGSGGWETRLQGIFGRTLGPKLGRQTEEDKPED
jgi:hypothetical protein